MSTHTTQGQLSPMHRLRCVGDAHRVRRVHCSGLSIRWISGARKGAWAHRSEHHVVRACGTTSLKIKSLECVSSTGPITKTGADHGKTLAVHCKTMERESEKKYARTARTANRSSAATSNYIDQRTRAPAERMSHHHRPPIRRSHSWCHWQLTSQSYVIS